MDGADKNSFQFGDFHLNLEEKVLRRNGEIVPLQARILDVLCLLVERRGGVVSKEELMETIWADSFVEESNITQSVYSLRKALGSDKYGKDFIETVPKRGYRLGVEVTSDRDRRSQPEPLKEAPDVRSPAMPKSRVRIGLLIAAAALAVLTMSGFLAARYLNARPSPPVENVKFQRLTFSGDIAFPMISGDGKSLAYVKDNSIYLQDVSTGASFKVPVQDHKKFGNLQFSNEGESILFRNEDSFDAEGDVFQVSRFGGPAKMVAQRVWSTLGFSPDGRQAAFVRFFPTQGEWALMIKDMSRGDERKLIGRNLPFSIFRSGFPAWSPDGKRIAIIEQTPEQENRSRLLFVNSETGESETIATPALLQIEQVAWLPENAGLILTGREYNRFFQLWRLNLPGGELLRVTNDLNNYRSVSVSADGKSLTARQFTTYSHIWTALSDKLQDQKQITFGNLNRDGALGLAWTPSGSIVYSARITGDVDLWSVRPADGVRRQLSDKAGANNADPFVTADGRYIYFESTRGGKRHIWRIDIDGSNPTQISPEDEYLDFLPVVSSAGDTVYYIQRNPKSNVLWRQSLADGKREMLTQQGRLAPGSFLTISPDGRYLAFKNQKEDSNTDTADIIFFDLTSSDEPKIVTIQSQNPTIVWSEGGRSFDYVDNQPDAARLWRQSFDGKSERRLILELPKAHLFTFAWSTDDKMLALSRGRQENDAILLTGF